jgi:hypothetical protein
VSNVLSEEKRQQVLALGRLGWPLRRIEKETGIRRETASGYLRDAGVEIRPSGGWGRRGSKPAKEVSPDSGGILNTIPQEPEQPPESIEAPADSKPDHKTSPDSASVPTPGRSPGASACEPFRDFIELSLSKGRNAKAI